MAAAVTKVTRFQKSIAQQRHFSIISTLSLSQSRRYPLKQIGVRNINIFFDHSWAIEPLEKKGLKLKVAPKTADDAKDEAVLDAASKKIEDIVEHILSLDHVEMAQFRRRYMVYIACYS
jgi:hypothetical protein